MTKTEKKLVEIKDYRIQRIEQIEECGNDSPYPVVVELFVSAFGKYRKKQYTGMCHCGHTFTTGITDGCIYICRHCAQIYKLNINSVKKIRLTNAFKKYAELRGIKHLPFNDHMFKEEYKIPIIPI
jgi:hypothetical protein